MAQSKKRSVRAEYEVQEVIGYTVQPFFHKGRRVTQRVVDGFHGGVTHALEFMDHLVYEDRDGDVQLAKPGRWRKVEKKRSGRK